MRDEALSYFFTPEQRPTTTPTTGGVNNVVNYVNTADGHRYVLRIYNNGNKTEKVCEDCSSQAAWNSVWSASAAPLNTTGTPAASRLVLQPCSVLLKCMQHYRPRSVLSGSQAWCMGNAVVLLEPLMRELLCVPSRLVSGFFAVLNCR